MFSTVACDRLDYPGSHFVIIAYHVIWSTYGFWLPNDERGSWSTEVWAAHLKPFGPATKVNTTRSVANRGYDRQRKAKMQASLKYPPVRLTGRQARAVGHGFSQVVLGTGLIVHACAIMPDHVHLVIARHKVKVEDVTKRLKSAATRQMSADSVRPLSGYHDRHGRVPTSWVSGGWCVYLDSTDWVRQCVKYVEGNPLKQGLQRQRWKFVTPYE